MSLKYIFFIACTQELEVTNVDVLPLIENLPDQYKVIISKFTSCTLASARGVWPYIINSYKLD